MIKIKINAHGFWTIKHLTCGATFQVTGDKIWDTTQSINCPNCDIPVNFVPLHQAVIDLDNCRNNIMRASERKNDSSTLVWQINPPIEIVDEEENKLTAHLDLS
jgi:hypothetical protein